MTDFASSFGRGIAAATDAERRKKEVDLIFEEMNSQIDSASGGKVEVVRVRRSESVNPFIGGIAAIFEQKQYWAIAVRAKIYSGFVKEIAKWKQDPAGYPCWIETPDDSVACEDRESLADGLASLLQSPTVGEALLAAMRYEPKAAKPAP